MQVTITCFWATPIASDCWGPVPPPKQGDFSRQNPQFTAQHGREVTLPVLTTKKVLVPYNRTKGHPWHDKPDAVRGWIFTGSILNSCPSLCFSCSAIPLFQAEGRWAHGKRQLPTTHLSGLLNPLHWPTQTGQQHPLSLSKQKINTFPTLGFLTSD